MITVRIWFKKQDEASYISLLDLQRVMQRVLKRSRLPVWHTLGFNPHIYMTFSCPLPLGQESLCESVDVKTEEENPDFEAWKASLRAVMPAGIDVFLVEEARMKAERIAEAEYIVALPVSAGSALDAYNAAVSAPVQKKSKRGMKTVELKEYIPAVSYREENGELKIVLRLPASQELNLNPALFIAFLASEYGVSADSASVLRTALLTSSGENFR